LSVRSEKDTRGFREVICERAGMQKMEEGEEKERKVIDLEV
jgi:hypothetical protein